MIYEFTHNARQLGLYDVVFDTFLKLKDYERASEIGDDLLREDRLPEALFVYQRVHDIDPVYLNAEQLTIVNFLEKKGIKPAITIQTTYPLISPSTYTPDTEMLLKLPDHTRKTAMTVFKLGRATADEISQQTHRARAVESGYANQLVITGYLKKDRKGRTAYFTPGEKLLKQ